MVAGTLGKSEAKASATNMASVAPSPVSQPWVASTLVEDSQFRLTKSHPPTYLLPER